MASSPQAAGAGKSSLTQTVVPLALLTLVFGGGGFFLGTTLAGGGAPAPAGNVGQDVPAPGKSLEPAHGESGHGESGHGESGHGESGHGKAGHGKAGHDAGEEAVAAGSGAAPSWRLTTLAPIVTNLDGPEKTWIRLQSALVYDSAALPHPEILFAQIMSDTVGFLRTQTLASIEGAAGLRRLQEDLNERIAVRSEGHVRELIIETMVVQ